MNQRQNSQWKKKTFVLMFFSAFSVFAQQGSLKVILDGSSPIPLAEIEYVVGSDPSLIDSSLMLKLSEPVICHRRTAQEISHLKATIVDPNGDGVDTGLNVDLNYNLSQREITADVSDLVEVTDAADACVTSKGGNFGDLIFQNGFITGLNYLLNSAQTEPGLPFEYSIYYPNESGSTIYFDLKEYFSKPGSGVAYFELGNPSTWDCKIVNLSTNAESPCPGVFFNDANDGKVLNAYLDTNRALRIDIQRSVDINSQIGGKIDLMTGIFLKSARYTNFMKSAVYKHQSIDVINNQAPQINWGVNYSVIEFQEGATTPRSDLTFFITDTTGDNYTQQDFTDYITSLNDKLVVSNIRVDRFNSTTHRVRFDIVPNPSDPDYFTQGVPEVIRVQIADSLGAFSNAIELQANINPVNDSPSFNLSCSHIVIDPTPPVGGSEISCQVPSGCGNQLNGNYEFQNFFCDVSPGPYENSQTVSFAIDGAITGTNPNVIDTSFLGGITAESNLSDLLIFTNDDEIGTAIFRLIATDNDSQNPLSSLQSPEITVEIKPVTYKISGNVINFPGPVDVIPANEYKLNLYVYDSMVSDYQFEEQIELNSNGSLPDSFIFNTQLENNVTFYLKRGGFSEDGSLCSIDPFGDQAPGNGEPIYQATVNGADVLDVSIDCTPQ